MDEQRWYFWRVGLVVLIAALAFSIMLVMFSDIFQTQYTLYIRFREAPGVTKDTPIRKHGITIGRVRAVKMLDDGVLLTCGIDSEVVIYDDEICQIKTASFLGDAELSFLPGIVPPGEIRVPLQPSELVKNVAVAPNPLEIIDVFIDLRDNMAKTLDSVAEASVSVRNSSDNIGKITGLFSDVMAEGKDDFQNFVNSAQRLGNKSELAIDNFNAIMADISELVGDGDLKSSVADTVRRVPELVRSAEETLAEVRQAIEPFKGVGARADLNLQQLESFTKTLGEEGPAVIQDIRESVAKIETLIQNVEAFTDQLKRQDGTVGKLFTDPQVYDRLNASLANIERITVQVQPLIADFRLFADSLARDPAQLGVRGALQRTSGAGSKGGLLGRNPGATPAVPIGGSWSDQPETAPSGWWPADDFDHSYPDTISDPWILPEVDTGRSQRPRFPRLLPQFDRPQWSPRL